MTTTIHSTIESSRPSQMLAALPADQQADAEALAWYLFQEEGMDLGDANREAVACIADVQAYATAWDAWADALLALAYAPELCDQHQPEPPAPAQCDTPATRKAAYHQARGVTPVRVPGGWLVPSGSRAAVIHRVSDTGHCSCEAGSNGQTCWHAALVDRVARQAA